MLQLLQDQEKEARMSYKLSVIDCNVPLEIDIPKYDFDALHLQSTVKLFQELEFRSLVNKLPKGDKESGNRKVVEVYRKFEMVLHNMLKLQKTKRAV